MKYLVIQRLILYKYYMLFSADYSQFLQSTGVDQVSTPTFMEGKQYLESQALNAHHDMVYYEFTDTITKRLVLQPYPANFKNTNPFCPLCLKLVRNGQEFATCYITDERIYLIHWLCLDKDKHYQMRHIGQVTENVAVAEDTTICKKRTFGLGMQSKKFYVEISFTHPIHDKNFMKVNIRNNSLRNQITVNFKEDDQDNFFPNIMVLPLTDFQLAVNLVEFGPKGNRTKFTKYISLRNMKDKKSVNIQCEEVDLSAEIIQDQEQQQKLMEKMNYKYKFKGDGMPMIRIFSINVKLPEEFDDSEDEGIFINSSSNIEEILREKEPSIISTIKSSSQSPVKPTSQPGSSEQLMLEGEKVNLEALINTNQLLEYVKNNIQSRLFQNFLGQCTEQQIDSVITYIRQHLVELIMHQYGNYMVQKLFKVCNSVQRLSILQTIMPNLCELVRNKQGTHTIQAFLSQFQLPEEYHLVFLQIGPEYYELCRNNNSTHFIQKVIKTFPLQYTLPYFNYTVQNLLAFALDKNAMCVIKHMIRRFRQLQGKEQEYYQNLEYIRRHLINYVTFNVDRLIMDSYGNYVIQFCYELFDIEKCSAITQRILFKFAFYANGKFSSNVILKCISIYWTDKNIYSSLKGLSSNQVVEIFKNKDGNRILLQIMEKLEGSELWDRLYSILIRLEPTRYYHDRWGVCLGSRSSTQVTRNMNFPEPKYRNKKKAKQSIH